jgi:hypothetical protein
MITSIMIIIKTLSEGNIIKRVFYSKNSYSELVSENHIKKISPKKVSRMQKNPEGRKKFHNDSISFPPDLPLFQELFVSLFFRNHNKHRKSFSAHFLSINSMSSYQTSLLIRKTFYAISFQNSIFKNWSFLL